MLKCFPFAYHNLQEDEYCHVPLRNSPLRTFRKSNVTVTLPRPKSLPTSPQPLPNFKPKNTKHIEKQEALRKAKGLISVHQGPELAYRYTRFSGSSPQLFDSSCHRTDSMNRTKIHLAGDGSNLTSSSDLRRSDIVRPNAFLNSPPRCWLHPDQKIRDDGVCYGIRYIGYLEVKTSMKSLDFDTRSQIAKECINRVCEAAGLKINNKKGKVDKRISQMLAEKPNIDYAGINVNLTITSSYLSLVVMESGEIMVNHEMPNISFASGGDADALDFFAYVAKDPCYGRACFVLECGGGLAQEVITTIGQAFDLRFKEFLRKVPHAINLHERMENHVFSGSKPFCTDDSEYCNDLPDKPPPVPPLPNYFTTTQNVGETPVHYSLVKKSPLSSALKYSVSQSRQSTRSKEKENIASHDVVEFVQKKSPLLLPKRSKPEYVNTTISTENKGGSNIGSVFTSLSFPQELHTSRDAFDMQSVSPAILKDALQLEEWFHGQISRKDCEVLVVRDGDFLVRESQGSPCQYILTGMRNGQRKHLLLVDPEGIVRTKDRSFESISHLINYHHDNSFPIIFAECTLFLKTSISRTKPVC
ncbi:SHC-transforming protein 1-like isoform X2 [Limulus polyphemus]|uniref:SHC-transforming protein 1-like isoform X2 n=1 Tax=Limulus polyphemus TaxID=6850 RepID=A0ABM1SY49_LIMPO|nr:SHC-transforming protein 1-like isoform X2 [Limulus polyphemus]